MYVVLVIQKVNPISSILIVSLDIKVSNITLERACAEDHVGYIAASLSRVRHGEHLQFCNSLLALVAYGFGPKQIVFDTVSLCPIATFFSRVL
jgi:hypothetical protein